MNADECDAAEHPEIATIRALDKQEFIEVNADNSTWETKVRKPKPGPLSLSRQAPDFQGYLERQSNRPSTVFKRRWVELRSGLLTWFSDVNGKPKGAISLDCHCTLRDDPECVLGFIILQPGHPPIPYFFKAYSLEEKEAWMRHVLGAISSPSETMADKRFGESGDEMSFAEVVFDQQFDRSDNAGPSELPCGWQAVPQAPKRKKTCLSDFELLSVIGRGTYGKVLKVRRKDTGTIHAMKVMSKEVLIRSNMVDYTRKEKIIMANINHPFLVNLTWAFQTKEKVYLVMDFLQGGELYVHLRRKGRFREQRAKFYAAQVVLAFEYLHARNIIFRDLKPENVVLGKDGYACLTDFGMARTFDSKGGEEDRTNSFCGTDAYLSPEMIRGEHYHCENDWWSLGVLLFEMLQGDVPFYNDNVALLYEQILSAPLMFHKTITPTARDLLCALLCRDKSERLTSADGIKRHDFFRDIQWDQLIQKELPPPFVPDIADDDTKYFDEMFTAENPVLSVCPAVDPSLNLQFAGFSYHGRGSPEVA
eukprot:GGOE01023058.1.p1 GENE.GGOE01023058.1~~GGOE01023058.1.p1  ORF type:complete len:568 (-),score=141.14 GGOE01023058.1:507-2111(-)